MALHLLGDPPPVTLFVISIETVGQPLLELSPELAARLPDFVSRVEEESLRCLDREAA